MSVGCRICLEAEIAGEDCSEFPLSLGLKLPKCFISLCCRTEEQALAPQYLTPYNKHSWGSTGREASAPKPHPLKQLGRMASLWPPPSSLLLADQDASTHVGTVETLCVFLQHVHTRLSELLPVKFSFQLQNCLASLLIRRQVIP